MGLSITIKCDKCGYSSLLQTGGGINDHNLDRVLSNFNERSQSQIKSELNSESSGKPPHWDFSHMIALCRSTNEIKAIPTFHIIKNSTDKLVAYNCDCRGEHTFLTIKALQEHKVNCPKCGAKLHCIENGFWD